MICGELVRSAAARDTCFEAASWPGWVHEIKHDGYRMLAFVDARGTRFYSRNKPDWSDRFVIGGYIVSPIRGRAFASLLVGEMQDGKLARLPFSPFDSFWQEQR